MKKTIISSVLLLISVFLMTACSGNIRREAENTADTFINSYYHAQYAEAAVLCDSILAGKIKLAEEMVENFPDSIRTEFGNLSSQIRVSRTEVLKFEKDSAIFLYEIFIPESVDVLTNRIILVRNFDSKKWVVTAVAE